MLVLLTCVATVGGPATALAIRERSCWPMLPAPGPVRGARVMVYGGPLMARAELPTRQWSADAMCPPQARTTFQPAEDGVPERLKVMLIFVSQTPPPCVTFWLTYWAAVPVMVAPAAVGANSLKDPGTCV